MYYDKIIEALNDLSKIAKNTGKSFDIMSIDWSNKYEGIGSFDIDPPSTLKDKFRKRWVGGKYIDERIS